MDNNSKQIIKDHQKVLLPHMQIYLQNKKVLDVGCGNGLNSVIFHEQLDSDITLSDYNDIRAKEAMILPFKESSIESLPFPDKEFDTVFVQFVLHHVPASIGINSILNELHRVGKNIIIIEELIGEKTNEQKAVEFDLKMNQKLHPGVDMPIFHFYKENELLDAFYAAGLTVLKNIIFDNGSAEDGFLLRKLFILK